MHWLGFGLCHQLPERSYIAGGLQAPVCARDTGIYLGFIVSILVIAALHGRERPRDFPRGHVWAFMGLLLAALAWDGVSSYGGLRETTNSLRLITGTGVGFSVAALIVPMLNDVLWRRATAQHVLDPVSRFALWVAALPVTIVAIALGPRLGAAFPVLIAAGIVGTLATVNLVIVAMLPWFDRKAERLVDVTLPFAVAVVVAFGEIALAGAIRTGLDAFARRLGG